MSVSVPVTSSEPTVTIPSTQVDGAEVEKELDKLQVAVEAILGPTFKETDKDALKLQMHIIKDECLEVANRIFDTSLTDFKSIIVQCAIIWYENRGVESQTRQGELGQENHFYDWHQYLQSVVVKHGKRYVI